MIQAADEVTAIVLEFGSSSVRAGYSGEEQPRAVFSSSVGRTADKRIVVGDLALANTRTPITIDPVVSEARIVDWDGLEALWRYALERLHASAGDHPVMLVLPTKFEDKERIVRMALEHFRHLAIFLAKAPVAAAFSAGRYSALVLDIGTDAMRITPVHDGYVVLSGVQEQALGGRFLTAQCHEMLKQTVTGRTLDVLPFEVQSKEAVELGAEPRLVLKSLPSALTPSFRAYHQGCLVSDFKVSTCQVPDSPFNERELALRPPLYYEFPDGFNAAFGIERFRIGELLFQPRLAFTATANEQLVGVGELINRSLQQCDVDIRSGLSSNIVLTGSSTLIPGLAERLSYELNRTPYYGKVRIHTGSTGLAGTIERRHGAWIGGSVLGSLGSFQPLWLTAKEFAEHGPAYIDKKCP